MKLATCIVFRNLLDPVPTFVHQNFVCFPIGAILSHPCKVAPPREDRFVVHSIPEYNFMYHLQVLQLGINSYHEILFALIAVRSHANHFPKHFVLQASKFSDLPGSEIPAPRTPEQRGTYVPRYLGT